MARERLVPSDQELARLLERGMSHKDIVAYVQDTEGKHITQGAVAAAVSRAGLSSPQRRYEREIPWRVSPEHIRDYPVRLLRLLGRRNNGDELNDDENNRLNNWLNHLETDNAVVGYDKVNGFAYIDRQPSDPTDVPIHINYITINN